MFGFLSVWLAGHRGWYIILLGVGIWRFGIPMSFTDWSHPVRVGPGCVSIPSSARWSDCMRYFFSFLFDRVLRNVLSVCHSLFFLSKS